MVNEPKCYSTRLLNPFEGVAQVLDIGEGRAISRDGRNWRIQIKSEIYKSPWSGLGIAPREDRYFVYGVWSQADELTRIPIHPTLYREHVEEVAGEIIQQLRKTIASVPFKPADNIELWLLDGDRQQPLVLLQSCTDEEALPSLQRLHWVPLPANSESFDSPVLRERAQREETPRHARNRLVQLVQGRTGSPPRGQWFRRHLDGSATALQSFSGESRLNGVPFSANRFPELMIPSQWENTRDQKLIDDYLAWLSPYLLTLAHLSDDSRARLERQAIQRASEVEKVYRLYPKIVNESLIKTALVEAVMRRSY